MREGGKRAMSRAVKALLQSSITTVDDGVIEALTDLHPPSNGAMTPMPRNKGLGIMAVDSGTLLKLIKQRVNNGSSPGPSGWTGSHLQLIAECDRRGDHHRPLYADQGHLQRCVWWCHA